MVIPKQGGGGFGGGVLQEEEGVDGPERRDCREGKAFIRKCAGMRLRNVCFC